MKYFFVFIFFFILIFTTGFKILNNKFFSFFKNNNIKVCKEFPYICLGKNFIFNEKELKDLTGKIATTIVIGSGPAGCSAALYASRLGGRVILIKGNQPGGQLTQTGEVENWPGILPMDGKSLMEGLIKQTESVGVNFIDGKVISISDSSFPYLVTLEDGRTFYAYTVVLATGSSPKRLGCKGEYEYWGRGVSTCAICDAPMFLNKDVVIVGGGDSACEEAMQLSEYAKSVKILVRGNKMRASQIMQERVKNNSKVEIIFNSSILEIIGNEKKVEKIKIKTDENEKFLNVSGVFIAIGHTPNNDAFKNLIELDSNGYVICKNGTQETSLDGIFAAGDIEGNSFKQAGSAAGDGIKAGIGAYEFLQKIGISSDVISRNNNVWIVKKGKEVKDNNEFTENSCEGGVCKIDFSKKEKLTQTVKNENFSELLFEEIESMVRYEEIINFMKNKDEFFLIKFSTTYCPACRILEKNLKKYFEENKNINIKIYSLVLDKVPFASENFEDIMSVPVIYFMKGDKILHKKIGAIDLSQIDKLLQNYKS